MPSRHPVRTWIARGAVALLGVFAFAGIAAALYLKRIPPDRDAQYVGSQSCEGCHRRIHREWRESLHAKMMRRSDQPGTVVADFDVETRDRRFDRKEAVWVIGSKWEQQFMGHDGKTETLLPGVWLKGVDKWDFDGWDGWEIPVPVRRCHGCHTVGLDVKTGHWIEESIGCESCHGPGGWHVQTWGLGAIHASADAQLCGQCHTRGKSKSGDLFFPAGYRPGDRLDDYLAPALPTPGRNSTDWWGDDHEKHRHQEYTAWSSGGHSMSLRHLREGYDGRYGKLEEDCLRCHSGDYILSDSRVRPSVADAAEGITCSVCHHVHGALDQPRVGCADCHGGGAFYHQPERNANHVACPEQAAVGCVGCHMPKVIQIGGVYALHSHGPGVIPPEDSAKYDMPNSCMNGGCHENRDLTWATAAYAEHYGPQRAVPGKSAMAAQP